VHTDPPECLSCGTCCFSTLERYVPVSGDDHARLADAAEQLVVWVENRAYLRIEDGHCAALAVDATSARFVCTVYARRPQICRDLERGSPQCAGELEAKRDRPAALVTRLGRALTSPAPLASRGKVRG
jgi:Fe-S-cluster containining protein